MASQSRPAGIDQDALERRIDLAVNDADKPDPVVAPPPVAAPSVTPAAASAAEPTLSPWQRITHRLKRLEQAAHLFLYRHHYLEQRVTRLHRMMEEANSRLAGQAAFLDHMRRLLSDDSTLRLERDFAELHRHVTWLRGELAVQKRRIERLDDGVAATQARADEPPAVGSSVEAGPALALRFGLADPEAAHRFRPHLDQLRRCATLMPGKPLLDLGCGHGDWLGVLQQAGIEACGVDSEAVAIEACRQRGLSARLGDPLSHLSSLPDASVAAVTGFLALERIDAERQALLVEQVRRVLVPGGFVQLECLSPDNLKVCIAAAQQSPPMRPLVRAVTEFMLASRGFTDIDVVFPEPADAAERLQEDGEAARRLNALLYGPRTYLISARRA